MDSISSVTMSDIFVSPGGEIRQDPLEALRQEMATLREEHNKIFNSINVIFDTLAKRTIEYDHKIAGIQTAVQDIRFENNQGKDWLQSKFDGISDGMRAMMERMDRQETHQDQFRDPGFDTVALGRSLLDHTPPNVNSKRGSAIPVTADPPDEFSSSESEGESSSDDDYWDKRLSAEQRRDRERRRSSIFGPRRRSEGKATASYASPMGVINIAQKTREDFPNVKLSSLNLEHVCMFVDQYDRISYQYKEHGLRMITFVDSSLIGKFTIEARRLDFIRSRVEDPGLMSLSDRKVRRILYHLLKATSEYDFIKKIKTIKFPSSERDKGFVPGALTFPMLYDRALLFQHKFCKALHLIGQKALPDYYPPVYKQGKTHGLVDYFLDAWPGGSGEKLYAAVTVSDSSLRHKDSFLEFVDAFMEAIEKYKEVKKEYENLEGLLGNNRNFRDDHYDGNKPHHIHPPTGSNRSERRGTPRAGIPGRGFHALEVVDLTEDEDQPIEFPDEHQEVTGVNDSEETVDCYADEDKLGNIESYYPDTSDEIPSSAELANLSEKRMGCFTKYIHGRCDKADCKYDHSEGGMKLVQEAKIRDIVSSKFAGDEHAILQKVQEALRARASKQQIHSGGKSGTPGKRA